jgi:nicotinamidase-related amidase
VRVPKHHPHLLHADNAALVVIDMQEPFLRNIYEPDRLLRNVRALMQGANALRLPVIGTTQVAQKMGDVIGPVKSLLPAQLPPFDKVTFSCMGSPSFASEIRRTGRKQILLCGVESHICVNQTAHDLVAADYQVHIVTDAVSSRTEANWRLGLEKMRAGRALMTSVEMALYELLHEADTPEFREILNLVKEA